MTEESIGRDPEWVFVPNEDRPVALDDIWGDEEDERR